MGLCPLLKEASLGIPRRMQLEASDLQGLPEMNDDGRDRLLALPCGHHQEDVVSQTKSLVPYLP